MKKLKYIGLLALALGFTACDDDVYPPIEDPNANTATEVLDVNGLDLSNYVSIGASFTSGFTDGALFIKAQENSFPNILASKFAMANGGTFELPLMNDNIGGFVTSTGIEVQPPRFYFNGTGPARIDATPTTILGLPVSNAGNLNNYGVPGAKSFHFVTPNYGNPLGLTTIPLSANPYFVRMLDQMSTSSSIIAEAAEENPTFFTISEVGGNDVLGYALSGGYNSEITNPFTGAVIVPASNAIYQADNTVSPAAYGSNDITNTDVFASVFSQMTTELTTNGAKGVVGNIPYITSLSHFTTVPYNPLDPRESADLAGQIPLLNNVYGAINQVYAGAGEPERSIVFATDQSNPVVVYDEDATDLTVAIATTLGSSPTFVPFVQSLGLPPAAAPLVAQLLGRQYGKARSATANDLFVLPSSTVIGTVNTDHAAELIAISGGLLPASLAGQFSAEGITLPLADKWVLTPEEQTEIKTATDAYNATISAIANANPNIALVDLNSVLQQASTTGITFDEYNMTTELVRGGLVSLDGVHLTGRGYALMANKMLEAMDATFGSNFTRATNGLAKANDHPTNYSVSLR